MGSKIILREIYVKVNQEMKKMFSSWPNLELIMHPAIEHYPHLWKLCKALFWSKTLRKAGIYPSTLSDVRFVEKDWIL